MTDKQFISAASAILLAGLLLAGATFAFAWLSVSPSNEISKNLACCGSPALTSPPPPPVVLPKLCPVCQPNIERRLSLGEASYFDFNVASIRPEAEEYLKSTFQKELKELEHVHFSLIGHTDPIGTTEYNMNLGLERAYAVRDALIRKGIISPKMVDVESRGETDTPEALVDLCQVRSKSREKMIACFQPLRRVDVIVTGISKSN